MRCALPICFFFLLSTTVLAQSPWPASNDTIPANWSGNVFSPNFDFPTSPPAAEHLPWSGIDFRTDPVAYMKTVLSYVLEGMDKSIWDGKANAVRQWYHAPWMHEGYNGREFIHGLTRERSSRSGDLGAGQTKCYQNWAVSITNPIGGYTYGQVWGNGLALPDARKSQFSPGTVFAKLLFTQAPASEVPFLAGAPEWEANINDPIDLFPASGADPCPSNRSTRFPQKVRLLQFDIAVRHDATEAATGWVYGTFAYDGRTAGTDAWAKLKPVGLMWGNDPTLTDSAAAGGVKPTQSIVLTDLGLGRPFGRGGRMNGPADNPESACLSCHAAAQYQSIARLIPPRTASENDVLCWFRNLPRGTAFGYGPDDGEHTCGDVPSTGAVSLDTSLQIAVGLRNYVQATGAQLPTSAETVPSAMNVIESQRAAKALRNWQTLSVVWRAQILERSFTDRGILTVPIHRGDPDLTGK